MPDREFAESVKLAATAIISAVATAALVIAAGNGLLRQPGNDRSTAGAPILLVQADD